MRLLCFADLHANNHKKYSKTISEYGLNSTMEMVLNILREIGSIAVKENVDAIIFGGDLFETKNKIPITVLNAVFKELERIAAYNIPIYMIPGNHDYALRSGRSHALEVLDSIDGVHVLKKGANSFLTSKKEHLCIHAVSYSQVFTEDAFKVDTDKKDVVDADYHICLTHGMVAESLIDANRKSEHIESSDSIIQIQWLFDQFDLVVAGHVHYPSFRSIPSPYTGKKVNILVPGQPWYQFASESNQIRGVWLVDLLAQRESQTDLEVKKIPVTCPKFYRISIEKDKGLTFQKDTVIEGNIILLQPETSKISYSIIQETRKKFEDEGAFYVEILPFESFELSSSQHVSRFTLDTDTDPKRVLAYVLHNNLVVCDGNPPGDLISRGEQLLDEAMIKMGEE